MGRAGRRDIIPFSGWTTTATLSSLPTLLVSSRVLYHVFNNTLHCARILESLTAETHLQTHHVTPTLQLFPLHSDLIDFGHPGPIPNDLGPQSAILHAAECIANVYGRWEVRIQHPHCFVGEGFNLLRPAVRRRVKLAPIVRAVCGESSYDVRVTGHVNFDVAGWCWASEAVGDGEGYRLVPLVDLKILRDEDRRLLSALLSACGIVARWYAVLAKNEVSSYVVDEALGGLDWSCCARCRCACISRGGRWPYRFGSRNSSRLPSSSSSTYTHPLGRALVGRDECWRRYFDGIFVVFVDEAGNLSRQRGDVRVLETNSGHVGM